MSAAAASGKNVTLLLVDDNPLVRDLIEKGLEPVCEVVIAADGADALLKVIDEPPDVILCDYKMPGLDGRQLFEKLRGRDKTRHIPFLFMAGRADIEERLRPLVDGVEEFITKPFLIKDLVRVTKKVVDRLHLEKLQKSASRPRRDPGPPRRDEHDRPAAIARNGAKIVPPESAKRRRARRALFRQRAMPRRQNRKHRRRRRGLQGNFVGRRRL